MYENITVCIMIKPLGPRIMRLRKNQPGMESLKRAAISRPPRGRGGASVSSRGEASLTSSGGDGGGIVDIVQQTINDYRVSQQKTGRREICVDWNVNGDHQSPAKNSLYIYTPIKGWASRLRRNLKTRSRALGTRHPGF